MSTSSAINGPAPRRGRGRRPASEVRADVLRAAADLLIEDGMSSVTFERVAATAGCSRTTVYKWWPSPGALAAEAYFDRVEGALEFPDTGDITADLQTQLEAFARVMQDEPSGRAARELIGASQTDPELRRAFSGAYSRPRRDEALRVLRRAQTRGEIREDAALDIVVDQLWGACYHRLLILDERVDEDLIRQLIVNALHGVRTTPAVSPAHGAVEGVTPRGPGAVRGEAPPLR